MPPMIEAYRHVTIILEKPEVDPLEKQITSLRVADDAAQGQARQVDWDLFANLLGASTATFWQHLMVATSTSQPSMLFVKLHNNITNRKPLVLYSGRSSPVSMHPES